MLENPSWKSNDHLRSDVKQDGCCWLPIGRLVLGLTEDIGGPFPITGRLDLVRVTERVQ